MKKYMKLIVAAVGMIVLFIGPEGFGFVTDAQGAHIAEALVTLTTLFAVWAFPNAPMPGGYGNGPDRLLCPPWVMIAAIALTIGLTSGCSTTGVDSARLDTVSKQLVDKIAMVGVLTATVRDLNSRQLISVAKAQSAHDSLQKALNGLELAVTAVAEHNNIAQADSAIARAEQSIKAILRLLRRFAVVTPAPDDRLNPKIRKYYYASYYPG